MTTVVVKGLNFSYFTYWLISGIAAGDCV